MTIARSGAGHQRGATSPDAIAAEILSTPIESVTIYPDCGHGPEAEVVAKAWDLLEFAVNDDAAPGGGDRNSMALVAGTGFEPVTFRL